MTENLYELNHLTSDSNGAPLQNSFTRPCYGTSATSSLQQSPVPQHMNQNNISSPSTPQNEVSPMLDISHGGEFWDCNPLEKSSSLLAENMDSHSVYAALNSKSTLSSKFSANDVNTLDSFNKAFSIKNQNTIIAHRGTDKDSDDNHLSQVLLSPPCGTPLDDSDREPFSPVTMRSQPQQFHNHYMYHTIDSQNVTHSLYPNSQQYLYPELRDNQQLYKPQNQYFLQQQVQIHQHNFSLALQKQQAPLDLQEGHETLGPTYNYSEECKAAEQPSFLPGSKGMPLHSLHFQGPQHFGSQTHQSNLYQHQQLNEQSHMFPYKQDLLTPADMVHGFDNQKEAVCMDLNYPNQRGDMHISHYQSMDAEVNQPVQSTTLRGGVLHLNSYRPHWTQMCTPNIQEEQTVSYYRNEQIRDQTSKSKLKCVLCQKEFKSLPALNGHMRSHGGIRTHPSTFKTTDGLTQTSKDATQTDPMLFPVSVPVKAKLSNSLQTHMLHREANESVENSQHLQISLQKILSHTNGTLEVGQYVAKQEKKRYRHSLVPLVISPCDADLKSRGPVLFQSRLRSPGSCGDDVPYTPPPMLSPVRPGSGLFNNVNGANTCNEAQPSPRLIQLCKDGKEGDCNIKTDSRDGTKPRINIGTDFQAKIPGIQSQCNIEKAIHKASLLWTPFHLDTPEKQQRVDDLLKMACSSVLPGGGTNTELTLHCLFECRGDVLTAVEKLLSLVPIKHMSSPYTDYHYAGSDRWTLQEKRQLNKALLIHNKDFHLIQKMVKTKSVAQCVEYYYTWKERLRLGKRFSAVQTTPSLQEIERHANTRQPVHNTKNKTSPSPLSDSINATSVCGESRAGVIINGDEWNRWNIGTLSNSPAEHGKPRLIQQFAVGSVKSSPSNSTTSGDTESSPIFPCTECGKVFLKVKSRNAHMKTHRQHDDSQFQQLSNFSEQENQTVTPASPSFIPLQRPITHHTLPCNIGGDVKPFNNTDTLTHMDCLLQDKP